MQDLIIALRIDTMNPVHTRISVFTNSKRNGIVSPQVGLSGQLTVNTELAEEFIDACNADRVTWVEGGEPPKWLSEHPMFNKALTE